MELLKVLALCGLFLLALGYSGHEDYIEQVAISKHITIEQAESLVENGYYYKDNLKINVK